MQINVQKYTGTKLNCAQQQQLLSTSRNSTLLLLPSSLSLKLEVSYRKMLLSLGILSLFWSVCCTTFVSDNEELNRIFADMSPKVVNPLKEPIILSSEPVQGLHLALKGHNEMIAIWLTPVPFINNSFTPACLYGNIHSETPSKVQGKSYTYTAGMFQLTLNRAVLKLERFENIYDIVYYVCGDPAYGWSTIQSFSLQKPNMQTPKEVNSCTVSKSENSYISSVNSKSEKRNLIGIVGDLGVTNSDETIESIWNFTRSLEMKILIHIGDISYADNFSKREGNNSYIWTEYMNKIKRITSRIPYMVLPGNHEVQFNFGAYLNWFRMPYLESDSDSPFWYSFDYMGVHFSMFSTEHDVNQSSIQYQWLENDLNKANLNRDKVPWVIALAHRPLYCSSHNANISCKSLSTKLRAALENLLVQKNVDVYVSGHVHHYERSYPVANNVVSSWNYHNPKAPVHLINGAGGNPEPNDESFYNKAKWRAFYVKGKDTGHVIMEVFPKALHFQYIRSKDSAVVDEFRLTRT
ncbi:acid phosphatase type 7-like [Octopus vulgaris]|uniref:Purple acid phosphatase n=2 Tax=Octopus TaxID=6643 RepID=A0AA36AU01_OCTVU|nr:acid phosphatase type 7-like [Octopus vulgaris]